MDNFVFKEHTGIDTTDDTSKKVYDVNGQFCFQGMKQDGLYVGTSNGTSVSVKYQTCKQNGIMAPSNGTFKFNRLEETPETIVWNGFFRKRTT